MLVNKEIDSGARIQGPGNINVYLLAGPGASAVRGLEKRVRRPRCNAPPPLLPVGKKLGGGIVILSSAVSTYSEARLVTRTGGKKSYRYPSRDSWI